MALVSLAVQPTGWATVLLLVRHHACGDVHVHRCSPEDRVIERRPGCGGPAYTLVVPESVRPSDLAVSALVEGWAA